MQALGVMLLLLAPACDFDLPEKFEMPTWFLDIKIPLVQKRYEMGNIANPENNIYPTPDSMGFQIVYEAEFPFTSLDPENLKIDFPGGYMETVIPLRLEKSSIEVIHHNLSKVSLTNRYSQISIAVLAVFLCLKFMGFKYVKIS